MLAARNIATVTLARSHPITQLAELPLLSAILLAAKERMNLVSLWMAPFDAAMRGTNPTRPASMMCWYFRFFYP